MWKCFDSLRYENTNISHYQMGPVMPIEKKPAYTVIWVICQQLCADNCLRKHLQTHFAFGKFSPGRCSHTPYASETAKANETVLRNSIKTLANSIISTQSRSGEAKLYYANLYRMCETCEHFNLLTSNAKRKGNWKNYRHTHKPQRHLRTPQVCLLQSCWR